MKKFTIYALASLPVIVSVLAFFFGSYVLISALGVKSWITFLYMISVAITIAYNSLSIDNYVELTKKFFKMLAE